MDSNIEEKNSNEGSIIESKVEEEIEQTKETQNEKEPDTPTSIFKSFNPSSLFGGKIGSEELLILAVILLISDSDGNSDIIWLLLLLLFVK